MGWRSLKNREARDRVNEAEREARANEAAREFMEMARANEAAAEDAPSTYQKPKAFPWTEEEDKAILALQAEHGNRWKIIAARMPPGRFVSPQCPDLRRTTTMQTSGPCSTPNSTTSATSAWRCLHATARIERCDDRHHHCAHQRRDGCGAAAKGPKTLSTEGPS